VPLFYEISTFVWYKAPTYNVGWPLHTLVMFSLKIWIPVMLYFSKPCCQYLFFAMAFCAFIVIEYFLTRGTVA